MSPLGEAVTRRVHNPEIAGANPAAAILFVSDLLNLSMEMDQMDVKAFADRVAGYCCANGVSGGVGAIGEIIALVLPFLMNLPCLKGMDAAQKQEWIEDHPGRARTHTIAALRDQNPVMRRREIVTLADRMLETGGGLSESEFASVHASCLVG